MTVNATLSQSPSVLRVRVKTINEDGSQCVVMDPAGRLITIDATIRPKGTPLPEPAEIWLIERIGKIWVFKAHVKTTPLDVEGAVAGIIAAEVEQALAEQAEAEALRREKEAALAAGILSEDAVILIQPTAPGPEHQNTLTLWIDTSFGQSRPMRWDPDANDGAGQWVVVVDKIAVEAARAAVAARQAAAEADQRARDAEEAAGIARGIAETALAQAERTLTTISGKPIILYGDPDVIPGDPDALLIGPGNIPYLWDEDTEQWVQAPDDLMSALRQTIADLAEQVGEAAQDLTDIQQELAGVQGLLDGKSTVWPVGSNPTLGADDQGDLRLKADGGVEVWVWHGDHGEWEDADPRVAQAINEARDAFDLAQGKSTTYFKSTPPTVDDIEPPETEFGLNDFWVDDEGRIHRWDGNSWERIKDPDLTELEQVVNSQAESIGELLDELSGIEGKIDGKTTIYVQDTAPDDVSGAEDKGDIWIDTAGGKRVYKVWVETSPGVWGWQVMPDSTILDEVNKKITTYYATEENKPTPATHDLHEGDLWFRDPDFRLHRWDGSAWVAVHDRSVEDALAALFNRVYTYRAPDDGTGNPDIAPPEGGFKDGDLWLRTNDNRLHYYEDGDWHEVVDAALADSIDFLADWQDTLAGIEGQIDGKATTYFQSTMPPSSGSKDKGDIWIDTSTTPPTYKVYDGVGVGAAGWQVITDPKAIEALQLLENKSTTYYSTTKPTSPAPPATSFTQHDMWVDTANGNRLHRWDPLANDWVPLLLDADAIAATARDLGSIETFWQDTEPSPAESQQGDLWIDTSLDGNGHPKNTLHRYDSNNGWEVVKDRSILDALEAANTAQAIADGKMTVYAQDNAPTGLGLDDHGDLWIDTNDGNKMYTWHGPSLTWIPVLEGALNEIFDTLDGKASVHYGTAAPPWTPEIGDIWIDTSGPRRVYKVWVGAGSGGWVPADERIQQALDEVASRIRTYYVADDGTGKPNQTPPPGGYVAGDLWMRSSDHRLHRYNGTDWVAIKDQAISDEANAIRDYILSRGTDLVTNGTGYLGDNTNFTTFTYSAADAPTGARGSFVSNAGSGTHMAVELIPVDPNKTYQFGTAIRQTVPGQPETRAYSGLVPYDAAGLSIAPNHYMYRAGTTTTLTQELKPGDTVIHVASTAGWSNDAAPIWRSVIIWDYTDPFGKKWPAHTYSRIVRTGAYDQDSLTATTIPLAAPWSGTTHPVGTQISNGGSGGSYMYLGWSNQVVTEQWVSRTGTVGGLHTTPLSSATTKFPPGTAAVKPVFLLNRDPAGSNVPTSRHAIGLISFSDAAAAQAMADSKAQVFVQATAPTGMTASNHNDLWIDTANNRILKRYDSTIPDWVPVDDTRLAEAITKVNGKITVYYQPGEPTPPAYGFTEGDMWIETDQGNRIHIWKDGTWGNLAQLGADAIAASARDLGAIMTFYAEATTEGGNVPAPPAVGPFNVGDLWLREPDNVAFRYNGTSWDEVQDSSIGQALEDAKNAQEAADGKAKVFVQDTEPPPRTDDDEGDIWIDTSLLAGVPKNHMYVWKPAPVSDWVRVKDKSISDIEDRINTGDIAQAISTANGRLTTSASAPSPLTDSHGKPVGAIWYLEDFSQAWRWTGTVWTPIELSFGTQFLPFVDIMQATIGELDGIRIKANSVETSKLRVGDFAILLHNPNTEMTGDPLILTGWETLSGLQAVGVAVTDHPVNGGDGHVHQVTANGTLLRTFNTRWVEAEPGDEFRFGMWFRRVSGTSTGSIVWGVQWQRADGSTGFDSADTSWQSNSFPNGVWTWREAKLKLPTSGSPIRRVRFWWGPSSTVLNGVFQGTGFVFRRHVPAVEIGDGVVHADLELATDGSLRVGATNTPHILMSGVVGLDYRIPTPEPETPNATRTVVKIGGNGKPQFLTYGDDNSELAGVAADGTVFGPEGAFDVLTIGGDDINDIVQVGRSEPIVWSGYHNTTYGPITKRHGLHEFRFDAKAGHIYRITVRASAMAASASQPIMGLLYRTAALGTSPGTITVANGTEYQHAASFVVRAANAEDTRSITWVYEPTTDLSTAWLVFIQPQPSTTISTTFRRWSVIVDDVGPTPENTGNPSSGGVQEDGGGAGSPEPPEPTPVQVVRTWNFSAHASYSQHGYNSSYNPSWLRSGTGGTSHYRGYLRLPTSARDFLLSSNTVSVSKIEVYLASVSGYQSSIPLASHNSSALPTDGTGPARFNVTTTGVPTFKQGEKKWFTLPTAIRDALRTGHWGIVVGTTTSHPHHSFYGTGAGDSLRPKVRITAKVKP